MLPGVVLLCASIGCKSEPAAEGASCKQKSDCAEGLSCLDSVCTQLEGAEQAEPPEGYCATVASLAGEWNFDATVIGAETLAPRGINGHYELTVTTDDCEATAHITKTGHDRVVYSTEKMRRSDALMAESKQILGAAEVTFALRKDKPSHTMTFVVRNGELFGFYTWTGPNWARSGMWGFLRGAPRGVELTDVEDFSAQPCEVACMVHCDVPRRSADDNLDTPGLEACMTACEAGERTVGCGPGKPLPEALRLVVHGPQPTFAAICTEARAGLLAAQGGGARATCATELPIEDKLSTKALGKGPLKGGFKSAQVVQVGHLDGDTYTGHLTLALETGDGWYWTDSLADLSGSSSAGVTVQTQNLSLRARELLASSGREVVVELGVAVTDSDPANNEVSIDETQRVALCNLDVEPKCMLLTTRWSSERSLIDPGTHADPKDHPKLGERSGEVYLSVLPGDRISVSTAADARSADRELADIYAW